MKAGVRFVMFELMTTPDFPKPDFLVRAAVPGDGGTILGFVRELARYENLEHEVTATPEDFERDLFGDNPRAEAIVACEAGVPVGYALYFHNYSTFAGRPGIFLEDLYIQPACRGRGYGKTLLVAIAGVAVKRKCARFEWSVLDWNEPSIRFYRSMGARGMEEWTVQRVDGNALMKLAQVETIGRTEGLA